MVTDLLKLWESGWDVCFFNKKKTLIKAKELSWKTIISCTCFRYSAVTFYAKPEGASPIFYTFFFIYEELCARRVIVSEKG